MKCEFETANNTGANFADCGRTCGGEIFAEWR
jgi:hypothetical protein